MIKKIMRIVLISFAVFIVIYFGIAAVLILTDNHGQPDESSNNMEFSELYLDYTGLPSLKTYTAGDGNELEYRHYPADSDKVLVLLHGSSWHSRYFFPLAEYISSMNLASVYTPDLRGHGINPERRGDIDYIGQYEDDIADFLKIVLSENPDSFVIIGGHSSGGGLAIRFAGSEYGSMADAYLLLAPYLSYDAPTMRQDAGGFVVPYIGRIIGLSMLNNVGISLFNYLTIIEFNMPMEARDGTETLSYSYRLNTGMAPEDYIKDLSSINQEVLVIVGSADESFYTEEFEPVFSEYIEHSRVEILRGVSHMGVVVNESVRPVIRNWIEGL
jgi:non-heme chloroperoxidase